MSQGFIFFRNDLVSTDVQGLPPITEQQPALPQSQCYRLPPLVLPGGGPLAAQAVACYLGEGRGRRAAADGWWPGGSARAGQAASEDPTLGSGAGAGDAMSSKAAALHLRPGTRLTPRNDSIGRLGATPLLVLPSPGSVGPGSSSRGRPGTQERHSGHMAAMDPTTLPRIYSNICKDDCTYASFAVGEAERVLAEQRHHRDTEERKRCRRQASEWRDAKMRREVRKEEMAQKLAEDKERKRLLHEVQAKEAADMRWKRVFERLRTRHHDEDSLKDTEGNAVSSAEEDPQKPRRDRITLAQVVMQVCGVGKKTNFEKKPDALPIQETCSTDRTQTAMSVARNLSWKSKSVPLDTHIELLRKIKKLRTKASRAAQTYEAVRLRFERLPDEERSACESAYLHFGVNPHRRCLDVPSLQECLYELGIRGNDVSEQLAVLDICVSAYENAVALAKIFDIRECRIAEAGERFRAEPGDTINGLGVNLYTFGAIVVPTVRDKLEAIRRPKLEGDFGMHDLDGGGFIGFKTCAEILAAILPFEVDVEYLTKQFQEERLLLEDKPPPPEAPCLLQDIRNKVEKEKEKAGMSKAQTVTFAQFAKMTEAICARLQRKRCLREREILIEESIDKGTFKQMRADILLLHQLYSQYITCSATGKRLTDSSCAQLFADFGLHGVIDKRKYGEGAIDFCDLLTLIEQIRCDLECDAFDHLRETFDEYAGISGSIPGRSFIEFLRLADLAPQTRAEQDACNFGLQDGLIVSATFDGTFDFMEVRRTLQRTREHLSRMKRADEVKTALENGFKVLELDELHSAFETLDDDGSGTLDVDEAWEAVCLLKVKISRIVFDAVYTRMDEDGSGSLDFLEFLKLLRLVRDREGVFADNRPIATLADLTRSEMLHLLTYFHINQNGEAEAFKDSVLLRKVVECMGVDADVSLNKRWGMCSFQDLCLMAVGDAPQNLPHAALDAALHKPPAHDAAAHNSTEQRAHLYGSSSVAVNSHHE